MLITPYLNVTVFLAEAVPVTVSVAGTLYRAVSSFLPVEFSDSLIVAVRPAAIE